MVELLRHGFKAEAERVAAGLREELGLSNHERFDCAALAEHLAVPILALPDLVRSGGASPKSVERLLHEETGFSALTVCSGSLRLIVYNPAQPPGRRANSLAHELSHIVLEHEPAQALGIGGCRVWHHRARRSAASPTPGRPLLVWARRKHRRWLGVLRCQQGPVALAVQPDWGNAPTEEHRLRGRVHLVHTGKP